MNWKPIETAPKDTPILVTNGIIIMAGKITLFAGSLWFDPTGAENREGEYDLDMDSATHWMELPALPEEQA